jgi:hypothetical protein
MPPRYSYWTIIAGGLPTAFRAADREELLPTFSQIRHKHPDAQLKWFARGKLWDSPESARLDTEERRRGKPSKDSRGQGARGRDWRPGGEHRDPRQKYKDAKKAGNARERKRKFERRQRFGNAGEPRTDRQTRPHGPQQKWGTAGGHSSSRTGPRTRNPMQREQRTFHKKSFARNQQPGERPLPPRPERPEREPRPREGTEPTPPPRPTEPAIPAPGPPERGRFNKGGGFDKGGRFDKSRRFDKSGRFNKKGGPRR